MTDERAAPVALVVDDDPVTRRLVRRALEGFDCFQEVLEAGDGVEAQALLRERPDVDVVLTDILMPRLDGLELLRWGREALPDAAWIILSGLDTFDTAVEAIRLGAFDFLAKPPRADEMRVAVRNALEQRRLLQERERLAGELAEANRNLREQLQELEEKSDLLRIDLERAEVIQRALLPRIPPTIERYRIHAVYRAGNHVGGDLYDVTRLGDRYLALYVADATGHGVTAAMLTVLFKRCLVRVDEESGEPLAPERVLAEANRALCEAVAAPGLFLTAAYLLLDTEAGTARIASAGHPPVLHASAGGDLRAIPRTGPALGLGAEAHYDAVEIELGRGDRLVLYSDGVLGAGSAEEMEQVRERVRRTAETGTEELVSALLERARVDPSGAALDDPDDLTLLVLEMREGASVFDNGVAEPAATSAAAMRGSPVVFHGEAADGTRYLALRGRVTWQHCDPFYRTAVAFLAERRPLVIDLSGCEYLDSTCLGTLHELVGEGDVRLHGVRPAVRELFEELDMERVLERISDAGAVPELVPLTAHRDGGRAVRARIRQAHETLAALSDRNQERFEQVLEGMRRDPAGR